MLALAPFIMVLVAFAYLLARIWKDAKIIRLLTKSGEYWFKKRTEALARICDLGNWLYKANRRRKRFERALKRERQAHMALTVTLLNDIKKLREENKQLSDNHAVLVDAVMARIIDEEERPGIAPSALLRNVKKKEIP